MEKEKSILWAHRNDIKGGKYLVLRRDNTVLSGPYFVLGPRDSAARWAMRAYSVAAWFHGMDWRFVKSCWHHAGLMTTYRKSHGDGDPDRGPHRKDDPAVVSRMLEGC